MDYEEMILARQESEADDCTNCPHNPRLTGKSCQVITKYWTFDKCQREELAYHICDEYYAGKISFDVLHKYLKDIFGSEKTSFIWLTENAGDYQQWLKRRKQ